VDFTFEVDRRGSGQWDLLKTVTAQPGKGTLVAFDQTETGEWVRVISGASTRATVQFCYNDRETRHPSPDPIFTGLAGAWKDTLTGGLLYGLGENRRKLGMAATSWSGGGTVNAGYYELDEKMNLLPVIDTATEQFIRERFAIPGEVVRVDRSSVLITDDRGRRWRLPLGMDAFTELTGDNLLRLSREVATERDLFSCHGTFYELPAENADGFAKIRPISSHPFRIHDYASYRGLLVMTGIDPAGPHENPRVISSPDGKAAVWAGVIDDLWRLGKPTGMGGPWYETPVKAGEVSDPYLIGFYDERTLEISHTSSLPVQFHVEVEPVGHGPWMHYITLTVMPGQGYLFRFPDHFQARWIRFRATRETVATTWLEYR
jgi:hypothetical protein